jgi:hypothetical protein
MARVKSRNYAEAKKTLKNQILLKVGTKFTVDDMNFVISSLDKPAWGNFAVEVKLETKRIQLKLIISELETH